MKTTAEWWQEMKADPEKLNGWLQRQYIGELAAVNLLSEILLRFGSEATEKEWKNVHTVMGQEGLHGRWMKELMDDRGIKPEVNASAERKYWGEVLPHVHNFSDAMAAAFHAERMRLERIRTIANETDEQFAEFAAVFKRILPHEEWHEEVFDEMRKGRELSQYHERGLQALNLVMAD